MLGLLELLSRFRFRFSFRLIDIFLFIIFTVEDYITKSLVRIYFARILLLFLIEWLYWLLDWHNV